MTIGWLKYPVIDFPHIFVSPHFVERKLEPELVTQTLELYNILYYVKSLMN